MDINSIVNNSQLYGFITENQRHETALSGFQSILDKALEDRDAVEDKALREACETFESYFLHMMFKEMRKTSFDDRGSFIPKSNAEKIFTDMMDEENAKIAAKSGGIGLAEMMYTQITKQRGNIVENI
jgi:flagellar protein FlgJ